MNKKTNIKLAAVFVVLLLIFVLPYIVSSQKWLSDAIYREPKLISFDFVNADGFVIKKGNAAVTLVKDKDTWKVNDKNASEESVKNFLDSLSTMSQGGIASLNKGSHKDFGVDEDNGYTVVVKKGTSELGFIIGSPAAKLDSFYLRKINDDVVYIFTGTVLDEVSYLESSWVEN